MIYKDLTLKKLKAAVEEAITNYQIEFPEEYITSPAGLVKIEGLRKDTLEKSGEKRMLKFKEGFFDAEALDQACIDYLKIKTVDWDNL